MLKLIINVIYVKMVFKLSYMFFVSVKKLCIYIEQVQPKKDLKKMFDSKPNNVSHISYICIYIFNAELKHNISIQCREFPLLNSSLYKNPTCLLCSKLLFFLSFYKTLPIFWIILHVHVLLRYESERVVKDEKKTFESINKKVKKKSSKYNIVFQNEN